MAQLAKALFLKADDGGFESCQRHSGFFKFFLQNHSKMAGNLNPFIICMLRDVYIQKAYFKSTLTINEVLGNFGDSPKLFKFL